MPEHLAAVQQMGRRWHASCPDCRWAASARHPEEAQRLAAWHEGLERRKAERERAQGKLEVE